MEETKAALPSDELVNKEDTVAMLENSGYSLSNIIGLVLVGGAYDVESAGTLLMGILTRKMDELKTVEQAKLLELFIDTQVLAEINGEPKWERAAKVALITKAHNPPMEAAQLARGRANPVESEKPRLLSKINLVKKQAGVGQDDRNQAPGIH